MKRTAYIHDFEKWRKGFQFNIQVHIRFSETDQFGHMNNTVPFIYFEEARIEFMKHLGFVIHKDKAPKAVPVVADIQCDFHRQLFFDEKLDIYVKADEIGNTSFDLHYLAVNQDGDIALTGRGRLVQVDSTTGKPVPLDESFKVKLATQSTACI
ncbi:acyl-CoA thioesterase [Thalassobacillus devorans]|uniref:acyl-CoA thioesterase n=1 Tax=Thalassobacillus devorans TaxID=279813 RepID=UPI0004902D1C|nr:thioesterase family protein [Thalassobacillus devorans]